MTTAPQQDSSHRKVLLEALSPAVVDAIDGRIRELSAEEAGKLIGPINEQLLDLVQKQKGNVVAALAPDMSTDVKEEAKQATAKAKDAIGATDGVLDKVEAGQPVAPAEVEKAAVKVAEARQAVDKVSTTLEQQVARHEAILVVNYDGERPKSRLDNHESRLGEIELRLEEQGNVAATAFAYARASISGDNTMRQSAQVGLGFTAVTFLLCCVVVVLSPIEWEWLPVIGLSAIAGGIAAAIMFLRADNGVEVLSYGQAATIVAADRRRMEGEARQASDHQSEQPPAIFTDHHGDQPNPPAGVSASAGARASAR